MSPDSRTRPYTVDRCRRPALSESPLMFRCLLLIALATAFVAAPVGAQDDDGLVTLNVRATSLGQVLEMISVQQRVNIVTGVDTNVPVTANFYDASLEEALDWVLNPLGLGWVFDGKVYHVMPLDDLDAIEQPLVHSIIHPNYMTVQELQAFVLPLLSARGSVVLSEASQEGIESGSSEAGGNDSTLPETMLVIDTEDAIRRIMQLVAELDGRPLQVLVQATMIEVKLDETNKFGVDLALLGGGTSFSDFESLTALDTPYSAPTTFVPGEFGAGGLAAGAPFLQPSGTSSAVTSGFTDPTGDGLRIGWVGSGAAVFIEALSEIADTNVLANTEVLALNKQRAELIIGGRLGYFGGTTVSDGISQQTVEFLEVGTQLRFRPFIGNDGFVRLEIHPQRGSGVVDPDTGLPNETTSEVTTNVMVRDGETVVIGGLIETRDVATESKVPVLGHLPGIGWLFSSETTEVERTEIITLITPHILENGETFQDGSLIKERYERDSEYFRDSFGIEARYTQGQAVQEEARAAMNAGRLEEARMLCDRALKIDPLAEGLVDLSVEIDRRLAGQGGGN